MGEIPGIDSKLLWELLRQKGVERFHHANTVQTSLTFIREGALLSRAYSELRGLAQTDQYTDESDKKWGVWDTVFLDGTDLHKKFLYRNLYGPVLFYIHLDILLDPRFPSIRVTRNNPAYWTSKARDVYDTIEEIDRDYLTGDKLKDGRIMFLFDRPEKQITLYPYCERILVDDPRVNLIFLDGSEKLIVTLVKERIENTLKEVHLDHIQVDIRHSDKDRCNCFHQYRNIYQYSRELFNKLFKK